MILPRCGWLIGGMLWFELWEKGVPWLPFYWGLVRRARSESASETGQASGLGVFCALERFDGKEELKEEHGGLRIRNDQKRPERAAIMGAREPVPAAKPNSESPSASAGMNGERNRS